jgi:sugar lactone lactonase YvrE
MNDVVADPEGRFWAGSMRDAHVPGLSALYRVELDGGVTTMLTGVGLSNGLAWSLDGGTMWYVDSLSQEVREYGFDGDGGLTAPMRRFSVPKEWGLPDGIAIDEEGAIWVAVWGGGAVYRFSPDGEVLAVVRLPVPRVTACAFGGPDRDRLFITTARAAPEDPPSAGGLYSCRAGVAGPAARRTKVRYQELVAQEATA